MPSARTLCRTLFPSVACLSLGLPSQAKADALNLTCPFSGGSDEDGNILVADSLVLRFSYDTITKKAVIIGNSGVAAVIAMEVESMITYLERTSSGAVMTTTITRTEAVHSRNTPRIAVIARAIVVL